MEFETKVPNTPPELVSKKPLIKKWLIFEGIGLLVILIGFAAWWMWNTHEVVNIPEKVEPTVGILVPKTLNPVGTSSVVTELPKELSELGLVPNISETLPTVRNAVNFQELEDEWGVSLTQVEKNYLDKNKFVLLPLSRAEELKAVGTNDEMLDVFDAIGGEYSPTSRKPANAKLVTPDVVLHAYHKFFQLTLEELEKKELTEMLERFLTDLYDNVRESLKNATTEQKPNYERLLAQITVPVILLENRGTESADYLMPKEEEMYWEADKKIDTIEHAKEIFTTNNYNVLLSPELQDDVEQELQSIYALEGPPSALFGVYDKNLTTDYTQFTPRSHYTKSSMLRAYFRTMMYLGRNTYAFKTDLGLKDTALLAREFDRMAPSGATPLDSWQRIMAVTGFYAGQADDITYTEWVDFVAQVLPQVDGDTVAETENIAKLAEQADRLRLPRILSDLVTYDDIGEMSKADLLRQSLGFRIMGQRFSYDAWILNNLTAGEEKTEVRLPSTPSAVFLPAVFGNQHAISYATKEVMDFFVMNDQSYSAEDSELFGEALKAEGKKIADVLPHEWFSSLQNAWIYVLSGLTGSYGTGFPAYMQSLAFLDKQIESYLGSYTELKHDTVLYAKQSYAEMGGGPGEDLPIPPVIKGFVEPNVLFWRKLAFLVDHTEKLFNDYGLFAEHTAMGRLREFKNIVHEYRTIAEQELRGELITEDQYETLRTTKLGFMGEAFNAAVADADSARAGLVTDIHTDGVKGQILYEANGEPYLMIALVGNENSPRAVVGVAYNHYEFTRPIGPRMTDEEWKVDAYADPPKVPAKNAWYRSLIP